MLGTLDLPFARGGGRPPCRPALLVGGTTSVSSGTALGRDDLRVVRYRCVRV
jgi:hypothetical protein